MNVIFDLDDTLCHTCELYDEVKEHFLDRMADRGFNRAEASSTMEDIDRQRITQMGFSKERWPGSMALTYSRLCEKHDRVYLPEEAMALQEIGYQVFRRAPEPYEGLPDALGTLKAINIPIGILTQGDMNVQSFKIAALGLARYITFVRIVSKKDDTIFSLLLQERHLHPSQVVMIGNSAKHDINPALRAGLHTIHVPNNGWSYDDEEILQSEHYHRIKTLYDVPYMVQTIQTEIQTLKQIQNT